MDVLTFEGKTALSVTAESSSKTLSLLPHPPHCLKIT